MNKSTKKAVLLGCMGALITLTACGGIDTTEVMAPREPLVVAGGGAGGADGVITYADTIQGMLTNYCSECHNSGSKTAGLDVTSIDGLLGVAGVVVPGDADGSIIVQVLEGGIMPPPGHPGPSADEIAAVRAWIELGAP